jgi:hypothetical protein
VVDNFITMLTPYVHAIGTPPTAHPVTARSDGQLAGPRGVADRHIARRRRIAATEDHERSAVARLNWSTLSRRSGRALI